MKSKGTKHKVLISLTVGRELIGQLKHPHAAIKIAEPTYAGRLRDYNLIIVDYTEFDPNAEEVESCKQIFEKQTIEALEQGATVCFLHHDEETPGNFDPFGRDAGYENRYLVERCLKHQAGFRWLYGKILIARMDHPVLDTQIRRGEFAPFLKQWGASHNWFKAFGDNAFDDIICPHDEGSLGFALKCRKGTLIYLPFQPNKADERDHATAVHTLLDCLLTYTAKRASQLPDWASTPFFPEEVGLTKKRQEAEDALASIDAESAPFTEAKALLVANEGRLETAVPEFIATRIGIPITRDEKFIEDFWLVKGTTNSAICEVKSVTKGFKKNAIYDVFNHRERNGLAEDFPAILFVNANLQAASWKAKGARIPPDECRIAAKHNVLIVRIEDLVSLWNGLRQKKLTSDQIFNVFKTERGWLQYYGSGIRIHKT